MKNNALKKQREKNAKKLFKLASGKSIAQTIGKSNSFVSRIKVGLIPLPKRHIGALIEKFSSYGITVEYLETLTKEEKHRF